MPFTMAKKPGQQNGDLPAGNTTIVVVVRFGFAPDGSENNFVMTGYQTFRQRR